MGGRENERERRARERARGKEGGREGGRAKRQEVRDWKIAHIHRNSHIYIEIHTYT